MAEFQTSEGRIHYFELGAGPPLVLIHGWPVSSAYWLENATRLSRTFRVLALDLPGFGRSERPSPEDYSTWRQARRVAELIRGLVGGPVLVVGHSMGGMISARLAVQDPSLVSRLVLVAAPVEGRTALSAVGMLGRFTIAQWMAAWCLKRAFLRWAAAPWFAHAVRLGEEILDEAGLAASPAARQALNALCSEGTREDLAAIRCPTLIIGADRDRIVHPLQPLLAKAWIGAARIEVLRDCGHCPNLEHPALFEDLVASFLSES